MKASRIRKIVWVVVALLVGWSLSPVARADDPATPRFRTVNAAPGLPNADVYVGNTLYFSSVKYGQVSNYAPVDPGGRSLEVRPAGIVDKDPNSVLTKVDWTFNSDEQPDNDYTMIIVGSPENNETPLVIRDDNRTPLTPGETRVRFVHVSRDAPALQACLDHECRTLVYPKESRFGESQYLTLEARTYKLAVRLIGTDELYMDVLPLKLQAGEVYTVFVLAPPKGQVRPLIVVTADTGQPAKGYDPVPIGYGDYPMDGGGPAPMYPPVTGALLSPTAWLILMSSLSLLVLGLGATVWVVRRRFVKS
ncbi:MAG: DUF4397 domain-containing protein [Anaerolineae bacterium]|nr:DUF4397 domain-containing protein [Anaerolineae bacterium]